MATDATSQARTTSVLRTALEPLGFGRIGRTSTWHGRLLEVLVIVFTSRSRFDDSAQILAALWHPSLSHQATMKGIMRLHVEAAHGDVGPRGIGAQHWWRLDTSAACEAATECLRGPARTWISAFADLRRLASLAEIRETPASDDWAMRLYEGAPALDVAAFRPAARPWEEGEQRALVRDVLHPLLASEGFEWIENDRQAAFVRKRGDLWDTIEGRPESNGVHTVFNWFVTTPRFGKMDQRFGTLLVQSNGGELGLRGVQDAVRCFSNDDLRTESGTRRLIAAVQSQALPRFSDIATREDFLSSISMGWEPFAAPLAASWKGAAVGALDE